MDIFLKTSVFLSISFLRYSICRDEVYKEVDVEEEVARDYLCAKGHMICYSLGR